jgi:hypothetical protein
VFLFHLFQPNPMLQRSAICCAAWLATICLAQAQSQPRSGRYQITSGTYYVCCGFTGRPEIVPLPSQENAFVELSVSRTTARMTLLNRELRPVIRLSNGSVEGNRIHFRQRTRNPYYPLVTTPAVADYTVTWVAGSLRISGSIISRLICVVFQPRSSTSASGQSSFDESRAGAVPRGSR